MKPRILLLALGACLTGLLAAACAEPVTPPAPPAAEQFTEQESRQIALEFLTNEPTYLFDGMSETVELTETDTGEYPNSWTFTYKFDSRHAGYGDRTGQMLAQVITPHRAVITVQDGNVTRAIMDEAWDMPKQQEITSPGTTTGELK